MFWGKERVSGDTSSQKARSQPVLSEGHVRHQDQEKSGEAKRTTKSTVTLQGPHNASGGIYLYKNTTLQAGEKRVKRQEYIIPIGEGRKNVRCPGFDPQHSMQTSEHNLHVVPSIASQDLDDGLMTPKHHRATLDPTCCAVSPHLYKRHS